MKRIIIILIITLLIVLIDVLYEVNFLEVNKVELETKKLNISDKIIILQISDLHNKEFGKNNKRLMKKISNLKPDMIVLTGDIIDGKTKNFQIITELFKNLRNISPNIYFVSGNNEWENDKKSEFEKIIINSNIKILDNSNVKFNKGELSINLCGVDDSHTEHENIDKAFKGIDSKKYTILLSHSPDLIDRYENLNADLILVGHTHGGQVRFPIIGGVYAPGQGIFPKYDKGLYDIYKDKKVYIDSGLGTSGLPLRFLNRSQVSVIEIGSNTAHNQ